MPKINVVVGPPCAGKSTYVDETAGEGHVRVDHDKIAQALGATIPHDATGAILETTWAARTGAIERILSGLKGTAWIIHTNPTTAEIARYQARKAKFWLLDPGKEACLQRAEERPPGTKAAIEKWYQHPPKIDDAEPVELDEPPEANQRRIAMHKRDLPLAHEVRPIGGINFNVLPRAFERWNPGVRAADDAERTISIYDVIGYDFFGDGVTAKRVAGALRGMGEGPVTVNINSPGGDMFEGLAIYNLLREHSGEVTVKVLGLAASAASVVAMAGDTVQIARAGFYMIHNAWVVAVGNRNDLREFAEWLEPFDRAMADVYAAHAGGEVEDMLKIMDAETWIGGNDAIEQGFADELLPSDQVEKSSSARASAAGALRQMEVALRHSGMAKSEAARLIKDFKAGLGEPAGSGEGDPAGRARVEPAQLKRLQDRFHALAEG